MKSLLKIVFFLLLVSLLFSKADAQITLNISADNNSICLGDTVTLSVVASGGQEPYFYEWTPTEFLITDNTDIVEGIPNNTMTYSVTVTDDNLLTNYANIEITVHSKPVADFTSADGTNICDGIVFTNNSSGVIDNSKWTFGADSPITTSNIDIYHFFNTAITNNFDVELITFTDYGCSDTATYTITVKPKPVAIFNVNAEECNGILFSDNSTVGESTISNVKWDFGDGTQSIDSEIYYLYTTPENSPFDVELIAYANNGCSDTVNHVITVHPKPITSFTPIDGTIICDSIIFTDASSISSGTIDDYKWTFGSDAPVTISETEIYHVFNNATTTDFDVELITLSDFGCSDTATYTITVKPKPVAIFNVNAEECNGILFSDNSTVGESTISNVEWDFGDGEQGTDSEIYYLYTNPENSPFDVELIAYANNGCSDTVNHVITVHPKPVADFTPANNDAVCNGIFFNDESTLSSGNMINFKWNFGDSQTAEMSNTEIYHFYNNLTNTSNFDVQLITFSDNNCTDTIEHNITVYPKPIGDFEIEPTCLESNSLFIDISTVVGLETIDLRNWTFGDGNYINDLNIATIEHLYENAGTFSAQMIVFTNHNCTDTITKEVIIHPKPVANFTTEAVCLNENTLFYDNSTISPTGTIVSKDYSFGNGNSVVGISDIIYPYLYENFGTYTVELIVYSDHNCSDTINELITIHPNPEAVNFSEDILCNGIFLSDTSIIQGGGEIETWRWNFGDGEIESNNDSTTYHFYEGITTATDFEIQLILISFDACRDTVKQTISILPKPVANFEPATEICNGIFFNSISNVEDGIIDSVWWDFGDNTQITSTETEIYHFYQITNDTIININIIAFADNQCTDTINHAITVFPKPIANIGTETQICNGTTFNDASIISSGTIDNRIWSFDDETEIDTEDIDTYHFYQITENTYFDIQLIAFSNHGCNDTTIQTTTIYPKPIANFHTEISCFQLDTKFIDDSENTGASTGAILDYKNWIFGDGNFLDNINTDTVSYQYGSPGTYPVQMIIFSNYNCTDTIIKDALVNPLPTPSISGNHIVCSNSYDEIYTTQENENNSYYWFKDSNCEINNYENKANKTIVHWQTVEEEETVHLFAVEIIEGTGCLDTAIFEVKIQPETSPTKANIIFKADDPETNILICLDFDVSEWQWGYDNEEIIDTFATWHFWDIPHKYNREKRYWVETSFGNYITDENNMQKSCFTRSYFNDSIYSFSNKKTEEYITLYPNPTSNNIFVEINNEYNGEIDISINNIFGKTIYSSSEYKEENNWTTKINTTALNSGLYVVELIMNNKKYNLKFLKT